MNEKVDQRIVPGVPWQYNDGRWSVIPPDFYYAFNLVSRRAGRGIEWDDGEYVHFLSERDVRAMLALLDASA